MLALTLSLFGYHLGVQLGPSVDTEPEPSIAAPHRFVAEPTLPVPISDMECTVDGYGGLVSDEGDW